MRRGHTVENAPVRDLAPCDRAQRGCPWGFRPVGAGVPSRARRSGRAPTMAVMPELPEVETVRRRLAPVLEGATIERAEIVDPRLTRPVEPAIVAGALVGETVAERRPPRGSTCSGGWRAAARSSSTCA